MTDLFEEKAKDWDMRDHVKQLSDSIGSAILENINLTEEMYVMDFGAGTGLISSHLAPKVNKITAVDVSKAMLENLLSKPELQSKVDIVCQDITNQPLDSRFDVIVSAMTMHHIKDTETLLKTLGAHLKSKGQIALADLDKEDGDFHPKNTEGVYHQGFDRQKLQILMENSGFNEIEFLTVHSIDKEGKDYPIFLVTASLKD